MAPFSKLRRLRLGRSALPSEGEGYNRKIAAPTRAVDQKRAAPPVAGGQTPRRSGFLVGGDVPIDEVADVVVVLLFFLEERIIGGVVLGVLLDIDVVNRRLGGFLLARLDLIERHHLHARWRRNLGVLFFFSLGGWPRASRDTLKHGSAFRADDRVLVEIKEFCAAVLALMFASEFELGRGDLFPVIEDEIFGRGFG
jgi:hypothetical protein